jgi:hypothetical protein
MSVQTLFAGVTVFMIYLASKRSEDPGRTVLSWLIISMFFIFMAADDAAQIHERLGSAFEHYAETGSGLPGRILEFFPSYAWQLLLLPIFAGLGLFMLIFLWTRMRSTRGRVKLILALSFFGIAVFLDFVEGLEPDHRFNFFYKIIDNSSLSEDFVLHYAKVVEEFLEMLGIALLFSMFFMYLATFVKSIGFSFENGADRR